jgi:transcriptional regulator with PAS, ATPase and Fis domain
LQEKDFERVGGTKTIKVDIRIIAATNKDLLKAVNEKNFREDLYFRLNVISIYLPTLRERKSDIPILLEHFIGKYNTKFNMNVLGVSDEVMEMLRDYNWPGNIREMENVIQRAMVLQKEGYINKEFLLFTVDRSEAVGESKQNLSFPISLSDEVYHLSSQLEKKLVEEALKITGGKRQETADLLGISRKSLHNKMKKYGIDV